MYLKRKIDDYLIKWKQNDERLPLIIKGARQIGKTESINNFAKSNYNNVVYINFVLEPKYKVILGDGYDVESIIKNITLLSPEKKFIAYETLMIFDEIQDYPDIATSLKAFKIDGRFDVICSGSLLGFNYKKIHSNSVGYKTDYEMFSMDFEDLDYCILGGMPAVVKRYIKTNSFSDTLDIQNQIRLDYEEDIRKYAEGLDQTKIVSVYRNVPAQLAKENKKFQYSMISKNARGREYTGCIDWLKDAGVVSICYCLNYPELPLKGNYDETKFKLYYPDTGLLISTMDEEAQDDLRANKNLGIYKGALYENFVAEAFIKQRLGLYYYKKDNSTLEEDFLARTKNCLVPIEVKSNNNSSKSLRQLIKNKSYSDIQFGIKLADSNIGYSDNVYTFPYFCAFMIKRYLSDFSS